jgi:prophage regulatory protein
MAYKSTAKAEVGRRIFRVRDVLEFTGMRLSQLKSEVKAGVFPKPVPLSSTGGRAIGWLEEELLSWREARIKARDEQKAARARQ